MQQSTRVSLILKRKNFSFWLFETRFLFQDILTLRSKWKSVLFFKKKKKDW